MFIQVHAPSGSARTTSTTTVGGPLNGGTVEGLLRYDRGGREVRQKHNGGPSKTIVGWWVYLLFSPRTLGEDEPTLTHIFWRTTKKIP